MANRATLLALLACVAAVCGYSPITPPPASKLLRASAPPVMPIGVPKVAYRVPGATTADWVDIYNRLYRERIIFLGQEIDDEICNQIIAVMLFSDSEDAEKPLYMYVNSPGGSVIAGLALYDTIQHISSQVITCNIGMAASMGSLLLAAGAPGQRIALPNARIMVHQPSGGFRGQASDIERHAEDIIKTKRRLNEIYVKHCGRTYEEVERTLDRDHFMSSEEAKAWGLVDHVYDSREAAEAGAE